jgi:hypothetical protein
MGRGKFPNSRIVLDSSFLKYYAFSGIVTGKLKRGRRYMPKNYSRSVICERWLPFNGLRQ